ncbi:MAG: AraC family transcriptional regulator [Myxococcota bacterium]
MLVDQPAFEILDPATNDLLVGLTLAGETATRWQVGSRWREFDGRRSGSIGVSPIGEAIAFVTSGRHRILVISIDRRYVDDVKELYRADILDMLGTAHERCYLHDVRCSAIFFELWCSLTGDDVSAPLLVDGLAMAAIGALLRTLGEESAKIYEQIRPKDRIEEYVRANLRERISLKTLADLCQVHPTTLARQMRHRDGRSVHQFVMDIKLEVAADRLRNSSEAIADIAIDLGFSDQSHFSRLFAKKMGISPGVFRGRK